MPPPRESVYFTYFYPIGFALMGSGGVVVQNWYLKRPPFAAIQKTIALGIAGFLFGKFLNVYAEKKWVRRDAIIRHYIELHPEDFKVEKRKYKQIFDEWFPLR